MRYTATAIQIRVFSALGLGKGLKQREKMEERFTGRLSMMGRVMEVE
jgi:hypothetical protein